VLRWSLRLRWHRGRLRRACSLPQIRMYRTGDMPTAIVLTLMIRVVLVCGCGGNGQASGLPGAGGAGGAGGQGGAAQVDASTGGEASDASLPGSGRGAAGDGPDASLDSGIIPMPASLPIPEAALTDNWCAPEASGSWEDTVCCKGVPCKGLCYEGDAPA